VRRSRLDGWLVYIAKPSIVGRLAERCRKPDLLMRCLDATGRGAMLNASRGWKGRRAGLVEWALPGLPFGGERPNGSELALKGQAWAAKIENGGPRGGGVASVGTAVVSVSFPASLSQKWECDLQFQAI